MFQLDKIEARTRSIVIPRLSGCDASNFVGACDRVLAFHENKRLPLAIEYGVSQALLRAAAHIGRRTLAEVICSEYDLPLPEKPVPITPRAGMRDKSTSIR